MASTTEPIFFKSTTEFRKWLMKNHDKKAELLVGFYKVKTGKPSMTWSESVDQALCFGWIDGVKRSIDEDSYCQRFTPRRPNSIWSAINIRKIEELKKAGLMQPAGLAAFAQLKVKNLKQYTYEKENPVLSPAFEKQFRNNKIAWKFFSAQAPSYQKVMLNWIMSAKQEKTKISRLERTIKISEQQKRML